MAQRTVNVGAPLRALLLLLAGAPEAVHAPSVSRPQPGAPLALTCLWPERSRFIS
jgi:hypothetical protein